MAEESGERSFAWDTLVAKVVHPLKVEIIEALMWLGHPLSAKELESMFDDKKHHYLTLISYHLTELEKKGAVEEISWRPVRGARETFYFATPDSVREA